MEVNCFSFGCYSVEFSDNSSGMKCYRNVFSWLYWGVSLLSLKQYMIW